jgi:tRNA 5-carboxymethoxyuridine methyltransferase
MAIQQDRNFDNLVDNFEQRIYQSNKGDWRLQLLKEDLALLHQQHPLSIWDAGCGFAQVGLWFAEAGHQVTLCDISEKMLERAKTAFIRAGITADFHHSPAQTLAQQLPPFDLVLFHAVVEWLAEPIASLLKVADRVKPNGYLSLLFYNRNAMVYSNTLKGGWRLQNLLDDSYIGQGKKLTPPNPQYPHALIQSLDQAGFSIERHTGIRVFHDYLTADALQKTAEEELFQLEYRYCRLPTYRDMGRYVHLLCKRCV